MPPTQSTSDDLLTHLAAYVQDEVRDKLPPQHHAAWAATPWTKIYSPASVPCQDNGSDCGVFTLM